MKINESEFDNLLLANELVKIEQGKLSRNEELAWIDGQGNQVLDLLAVENLIGVNSRKEDKYIELTDLGEGWLNMLRSTPFPVRKKLVVDPRNSEVVS